MAAHARAINFNSGPSALPVSVLEEASKGLLNYNGTGIGIAETSHRSPEFTAIITNLADSIRKQLGVPPTHEILFTQGGATGQFSAVVLNMLARHRLLHPDLPEAERTMDYIITGSWSNKAYNEARRLGGGTVHVAADARKFSADGKSFDNVPNHQQYSFSPDPAMIYYCENETIDGVEFSHDLSAPAAFPFHFLKKDSLAPLVGDYSSSFMSRPIPRLADHAIIFAGAQKNIGPAGMTVLIVRKDCIVDVDAAAKLGAQPVPITMSYKTLSDHKSVYNTPSVFSIYIAGLVANRMYQLGGMEYYEELNKNKSNKVYAVLQEGIDKGIYKGKVREGSRSWMNIPFSISGDDAEERFLAGAEELGMKQLKGHPTTGGIRISIYNATTDEQTDQLVAYMKAFIDQETKANSA